MIARIAGRVEEVNEGSVLVDVGGGVWYEVLVPVCEVERLAKRVGQDVVLYTIHYHEGDPSHGAVTPRLLGFLSPSDRDFFRVFTTVKGVGMRKALRAMARPVGELAAAIQAKDVRFLKDLPEIGPKMAERIAAELSGQMDEFAGPAPAAGPELSEAAEEAVLVLVQLGERRPDAIALVERVLAVAPDLTAPEAIIQQAYKLKAGGI
ncbi:MAG: Holliday junction ATP-dependent DNA helicase RuvA [Planctomycetes bacterium ADurb.Bin126]|nr:MAG: Holliday junction ATP-dependent DNA helicase RuvA [Planctomycetes bacterium ADurb.Bin126]HOD84439.1 OB-fold domain-containing protein [Phycisphaerae bacterium]HQL73493.1 OB-fold domain-containing protein [Phycisphaerae bacterium]